MSAGSVLVLRRQCGNQRVIRVRVPDLCGTTRGAQNVKELNVGLVVFGPLLRGVILIINGLDRANGFTGAAVNAFVRVDVERAFTFVDTVNRAFLNTCLVLHIHAWLRNYIRHDPNLPYIWFNCRPWEAGYVHYPPQRVPLHPA